jgi:bifunctional NMN adenylyltransferase/nudix hydrolase
MPLQPHHAAVLIGRFQPFHDGHLALLRRALELAPQVVVVLGSAFQARSPKHPWSWQERAGMVSEALAPAERHRVSCVPVRDFFDDRRWLAAVQEAVARTLGAVAASPTSSIVLVGHLRDATRDYLHAFAPWALQLQPAIPVRPASEMRDALFADPQALPTTLAREVPPGTLRFLRAWSTEPCFAGLAHEAALLRDYDAAWAVAPYPPILVTVDCVVKCRGHALIIRRGRAPGKGLFAVPGGFLEQRETTAQAALRELEEETHLALDARTLQSCLVATDVFDRPDRSQRKRTITHGYFFDLGEREFPQVRADDDAEAAEWTPLGDLAAREEQFLDDHFQMLDHYLGLLPR